MRTLIIAIAGVVLVSGTALACRGTTEFPEASAQLEKLTVSSALMQELQAELDRGQAMHENGHKVGDGNMMAQSLQILDDTKRKIVQ